MNKAKIAALPLRERPPSGLEENTVTMTHDAADMRQKLRQFAVSERMRQEKSLLDAWSVRIVANIEQALPQPPAQIVGCYWPMRNEPDLRSLMQRWHSNGITIALPRVVASDSGLSFHVWQPGEEVSGDATGIPTPCGAACAVPELLLVPLNAFDADGFRLGYGGGYYDRTLAAPGPRPFAIGVGFELGRVATVWPQAHDIPMAWIVTEAGVFKIRGST